MLKGLPRGMIIRKKYEFNKREKNHRKQQMVTAKKMREEGEKEIVNKSTKVWSETEVAKC